LHWFDIAAAKLAIDSQVKQGEVTYSRPSTSNRVLIDQTCFGRRGGLAPISLPLFQGVRWLAGERFPSSGMVVLLRYKDDEHAPRMQAAKSCLLSECYGHENACARIGLVASDPKQTWQTLEKPTRASSSPVKMLLNTSDSRNSQVKSKTSG
jgi:hypothetical protein